MDQLPLQLESYPLELRKEIQSVVAELLQSPPVPPGDNPQPTFSQTGELKKLPELTVSIIGVSGRPHSGKDVFADYLLSHYQGVARLNFSDPIIAEANRWLALKGRRITAANKSNPLHRRLLQLWGRSRRFECEQYWVRSLHQAVQDAQKESQLVIVAGVRAESDLALIEQIGGICLRVTRPGNPYRAEDPIEAALDCHLGRMTELFNPAEDDLGPYILNIEALIEELSINPAPS